MELGEIPKSVAQQRLEADVAAHKAAGMGGNGPIPILGPETDPLAADIAAHRAAGMGGEDKSLSNPASTSDVDKLKGWNGNM